MINGKIFAKFQKLFPKMNKGLKTRGYARNAFFMADDKGCAATDRFSLLYAPVEDACEQPVALTELPKAKFGDAVFIEAVGKFDATVKDGGTSVNVRKDGTGKEQIFGKMRELYTHDTPAYDTHGSITVNATLLKNLLEAFDGNVRIEITNPEGAHCKRQLYLHDVSSGDNLQAMLLPVSPVETRK